MCHCVAFVARLNVLIGAPRAIVSTASNVSERGAVYSCPWQIGDGCKQIQFDNSGKFLYIVLNAIWWSHVFMCQTRTLINQCCRSCSLYHNLHVFEVYIVSGTSNVMASLWVIIFAPDDFNGAIRAAL